MYRFSICTFLAAILSFGFVSLTQAKNNRSLADPHQQNLKKLREYDQGNLTLNHQNYIDLLNEIAIHYRFKNADSIEYYAQRALRDNIRQTYMKGYVTSEIYLAFHFTEEGDYPEALKRYQRIKEEARELGDPNLLVTLLGYWSLHDMYSGAQKELIKHNYESIAICRKNGFLEEEAKLRHNLGYTYYKYGLHDKAHTEYLKADSLWQEAGRMENAAYTQSNIALNALEQGNLENFRVYRNRSIALLEPAKDPLWSSRAYRVAGRYYLQTGQLDSSQYWFDKSQAAIQSLNGRRDQLELYTMYTDLYIKKRDLDLAEEHVLKALELSREFKDSLSLISSYEQYKEIAMLQGDMEKTYAILMEYTDLKSKFDKVVANKSLDFHRAQSDYEREKLEQQTALAKKDWVIAGILILLISVIAILYLARKNYATQKAANRELSQLNASKDKLFSIISHDLISPVNTLKEMLALYKENVLTDSEVLESIPRLKSRVDMSSFTLNNLLYWAQTQMSGFRANPKTVDLKSRASMACELFKEELTAKDLSLDCTIPLGYTVWFDLNHLDVILRNLISNAIKFSPMKGEIRFRLKKSEGFVSFEIHNSGESIPESIVFALQNDYTYSSSPGTQEEKGTGVGLKISKELTELNGGVFGIFAKPEGGTYVEIKLPKAAHLKAVI
jgi:signal transduction histidine kinase